MDNKNEITETDLVEVAMPEVTSEENPESKTEAAGKKPKRKNGINAVLPFFDAVCRKHFTF